MPFGSRIDSRVWRQGNTGL